MQTKTKLPAPVAKKPKKSPRRPARSNLASVNLTPFIVKQDWVNIEVQIPASQREFFDSMNPYFVSKLGQDVANYSCRPCHYLDAVESGKPPEPEEQQHFEGLREFAQENGEDTKATFVPLEIQMMLRDWESVCRVARAFGVSSANFVRAALAEREFETAISLKKNARKEACR